MSHTIIKMLNIRSELARLRALAAQVESSPPAARNGLYNEASVIINELEKLDYQPERAGYISEKLAYMRSDFKSLAGIDEEVRNAASSHRQNIGGYILAIEMAIEYIERVYGSATVDPEH